MTSTSRAYYEQNLGAGMFIAPDAEQGLMGYTEPLRRFIQPEGYTPQVKQSKILAPLSREIRQALPNRGRKIGDILGQASDSM